MVRICTLGLLLSILGMFVALLMGSFSLGLMVLVVAYFAVMGMLLGALPISRLSRACGMVLVASALGIPFALTIEDAALTIALAGAVLLALAGLLSGGSRRGAVV